MAPLFKFETEEQVIEMANNTEFGLASYFYSKDVSKRACRKPLRGSHSPRDRQPFHALLTF
ncbi:acyl-CoA reductase-like NAD-dependent aldehyde dehydrogenase (plasmid) [Ensifer sp. WSM1721]